MIYASLDIGLKRIGVALCLDEHIVLPQDAILRKNREQAARDVNTFLTDWKIEKLIIGLPKGGSSEDEMKRRIEHFIALLHLSIPYDFQDEYGTSHEADERLAGRRGKRKDGKADSIAASIILERYLNII